MVSKNLLNYYETEARESLRLYDFSDPAHYFFDKRRMELVLRILEQELSLHSSFLDLGCGDGTYLYNAVCDYGVGVDLSKSKLKLSKKSHTQTNYDLVKADAEFLPFKENAFDVILASEMIEHVPNPLTVMREIARICRFKAIISTPTQTTIWRLVLRYIGKYNKYGVTHLREFTQQELVQSLNSCGLHSTYLQAAPILEFPFSWILLKNLSTTKVLSKFDVVLERFIPSLRRFGIFTCVVCSKKS